MELVKPNWIERGLIAAGVLLVAGTEGSANPRPSPEAIRKHVDPGIEMFGRYAPVKLPLKKGIEVWNPTAIEQGPGGVIYVANYTGEIYSLHDTDGDGLQDTTRLFCNVTDNELRYPTCMAWKGRDLYVGTTQEIRIYTDTDGDGRADQSRLFFDDFPWTLHVFDWTFGLTFGPDEHAYVVFCTDYLNGKPAPDPNGYRGAIVRISPDGKKAERFATGLRYAYDLVFNDEGDLFFSDNKGGGNPTEEFNHAVRGSFHGHDPNKKYAGHPEAIPTLVKVKHGFGSGGLAFNSSTNDFGGTAGQVFLACWGPDGRFDRGSITRFELEKEAHGTYRAKEYPVAKDCAKVIDLAFGPEGDLYAAQFGTEGRAHRPYGKPMGAVYRFVPVSWMEPEQLAPARFVQGDAANGKKVYTQRACHTCHEYEGRKETVGPPLHEVGEMFDREEILAAIRKPGRGVKSGYETQRVTRKDGVEVLGRLVRSSEKTIELAIPGNTVVPIPRADVASIQVTGQSLMPVGLLEGLSEKDLNDLLAYLRVREARKEGDFSKAGR